MMGMKKRSLVLLIAVLFLVISGCAPSGKRIPDGELIMQTNLGGLLSKSASMKKIYFAGGCFWGVEAYFEKIEGVEEAISGYANGDIKNPSYNDVVKGTSGFAETVEVTYDEHVITLEALIRHYFKVIDPTSLNKQGNDRGTQYRTGIYYKDPKEKELISKMLTLQQLKYDKPIVVENVPMKNFYRAEPYHQDYLKNNPNGYCHIDLNSMLLDGWMIDIEKYPVPSEEQIKENLTYAQYRITQLAGTDDRFAHEYTSLNKPGIYVDVVSGEPLFSSTYKYDSGSGWPSFTQPILEEVVTYSVDDSKGIKRIEVRSRIADSHLGHVFTDGPIESTGLRYCMNGSAFNFIEKSDMEAQGYGYLLFLFD